MFKLVEYNAKNGNISKIIVNEGVQICDFNHCDLTHAIVYFPESCEDVKNIDHIYHVVALNQNLVFTFLDQLRMVDVLSIPAELFIKMFNNDYYRFNTISVENINIIVDNKFYPIIDKSFSLNNRGSPEVFYRCISNRAMCIMMNHNVDFKFDLMLVVLIIIIVFAIMI